MSDLVSDTHTAIWYFANSPRLSPTAKSALNNAVQQGATIYLPTIAATAFYLNLPLVTADHKLHAAAIQTIW